MPLPPLGHTLLTQPLTMHGAVYIPELSKRLHELPPRDVTVQVAGIGAEEVVAMLQRNGRRAKVSTVSSSSDPQAAQPRWRLWRPDGWVEKVTVPAGIKVLDFGCGSGRDSVALACHGGSVTGYDILPDALDRARDLERRYSDGPPIEWTTEPPAGLYDLVLLLRCGRPELVSQALSRVRQEGRLVATFRSDRLPDLTGYCCIRIESGPDWTQIELVP